MIWELKSDIQQSTDCMFLLLTLNGLENTISKVLSEKIHFLQCIPPQIGQNGIPINLKSCQLVVSNVCFSGI